MPSREELVVSTEGKTDCLDWKTDGWGGYPRVLPEEVNHQVGKKGTSAPGEYQRDCAFLKQEGGIGLHFKFGKVWEQTKVTARLVVSYFNWLWENSRLGTTAAQKAGLTEQKWTWDDLATYPTVF